MGKEGERGRRGGEIREGNRIGKAGEGKEVGRGDGNGEGRRIGRRKRGDGNMECGLSVAGVPKGSSRPHWNERAQPKAKNEWMQIMRCVVLYPFGFALSAPLRMKMQMQLFVKATQDYLKS